MAVVTLRDRMTLFRTLRAVRPELLTVIIALLVVESLVPAGTAVALALLVGRVHEASKATLMTLATAPLAMFGVVLLVGHGLHAVRQPLEYLATALIDGAHRAEVARQAATSHTIAALERPAVRRLIRVAKADSDNWTERSPGTGALAQLRQLSQAVGLASSSAVLAAYAWWLIPLLILPAVLMSHLGLRQGIEWYHRFRDGMGEGLRADVWQDAIFSSAEGKEIRVFGLGQWAVGRANHHIRAMFKPVWAVGARIARQQWQQVLLALVPLGIAYVVVAFDAAGGGASVAVATAVFAAGTSVYQAFSGDPRVMIGATACLRAAAQLREELAGPRPARATGEGRPTPATADARPAPATGDGRSAAAGASPAHPPPVIRFEGVCFTYPGTDREILRGLDLHIRPGELLAVVGLNGAGKSTLIKLLAMLYEPTAGRITADGADLAGLDPDRWRQRISIVFQDFVRYHLPARDNVALGNGGEPSDQTMIEAAASDAGFDEVLDRLPDGWSTPLSKSRTGGVDLSGGQWQQVVLARARYAVRTGAGLLVLDEPTAHLDVRTEFEVFERLAASRGDTSVVLISHRLSTVRQADRIVLLDGGRITESGTHDELMALGGGYAEMFTIQAERFNRGYDDRIEEGELL